jgi:DNA-binding transcriptional MerR regulator
MFRIGEFSRIARVSARLLRYYDELGLLRPGVVDASTGYRYYASSQLQRLNRILVLKDLGLSLEQIGGVIDQQASAAELRAMLEVRRADAEQALAQEATRLRLIEARIAQLDSGQDAEFDDVVVRAEPALRILSVREIVGSFLEARAIVGELVKNVPRHWPRENLGPLIGIMHSSEFELDEIDVEIGFVVKGEVAVDVPPFGARSLTLRELPAVPHMATCVRIGVPEFAQPITAKIGRFIETHGYRLAGANRDVFLRPPRLERMEESVVEMQFPVAPVG